ncbi:MAG: HAD-IC family P-type ATPase, partial [Chthoniobacterales bacterium]
ASAPQHLPDLSGELRLAEVNVYVGSETVARELAVSLAALSEHPLSRAIQKQSLVWAVKPQEIAEVRAMPGHGITGERNGLPVFLGKKSLMPPELFAGVPLAAAKDPTHAEVWVSGAGVLACLRFADEIRDSTREMVRILHQSGVKTVMLTGDRVEAAQAMQNATGIHEFRAGLLPAEKLDAIQELKANGAHRVAMIGDGVNDAPCLAAADVGVAMGARGSDAALEQADIVLMNDKLENFLFAQKLSQSARKVIHQNIAISLGTVVLMAIGAFLFPIPLGIGVFAHEGSTVVVVLNALRLLAVRL